MQSQGVYLSASVIYGHLRHKGWVESYDRRAAPMFRRIMRLTNYQNPYDYVLAASNAKRLGVAPRAGRVGLAANAH
ncbi:MAG TPA: hypothetical protein VNM15_09405, partial [Candidatus Binatia bacterium]|nr:hypothetical protein [Candidatus Binatia bacterium]